MIKLRHGQVAIPVDDDGLVVVSGMDVITSVKYTTKPMQLIDLQEWVEGESPIQEVLHYLDLDDREFLITGFVVSEHSDMYN